MSAMIQVEHLSKRYGTFKAVDDISLDVAPGEIHGFLGPVSYTHLTLPTIYSV